MRILLSVALAAVVAVALGAAPASAKKADDEWAAKLNCFGKAVAVTSGKNMFAPLVEVRTGKRYKPLAWDVVIDDGRVIQESRRDDLPKRAITCSYEDDQATGTVVVKPI